MGPTRSSRCCLAAAILLGAFASRAQPNVTPFQPPGWSDKIVVGPTATSSNYSGALAATNDLYISWAVINSGTQNITNSFVVDLYVDGSVVQSWNIPSLPVDYYDYITGYSIGALSAGIHTVEILADATLTIPNDETSDDSYTKSITIGSITLPAPLPDSPLNGATGQSPVPTFTWNNVANALSYRVIIATNSADLPGASTATNGGAGVVIDAVTPTNTFTPSITLNTNTTYYWNVHARTTTDDGVWSASERFATGGPGNGIIIVPSFDSTITNDPNAATIEATIKAAIAVYRFDFSNQVTANFTFAEMNGGLGDNSTYEISLTYSAYRSALVSHATSADDATALAHLPGSSTNPVNGNSSVTLKLPLARALGFDENPPTGSPDSTVYLDTSEMNLSSFETDPTKYSLFATVSHEMDEALGFGSALNGLANGDAPPTGAVLPEDLFRYDQNGNRSLTTALNATAYFSLDGSNDLAQFNQDDGGDFGDWFSYDTNVIPQVQDAFLAPGVNPVLNVELRGLDVIGYTRVVNTGLPAQLSIIGISGGNFILNLTGAVGAPYVLQTSTNLLSWTSVSTNVLPNGGRAILTNAFTGRPGQFYRAILQ